MPGRPGERRRPRPAQGSAWLRWAAPLALLAAALLGVLYFYNTQGGPAPNPAQQPIGAATERPVADRAEPNPDRVTPAIKDASKTLTRDGKTLVETASKMVSLSLPGNVKLDVPENSLPPGDGQVPERRRGHRRSLKSFVADNVDFEGTSAKLTGDSSTAITSLATILKAFGTAKLKIDSLYR